MRYRIPEIALAVSVLAVAACGGGGGGGTVTPPSGGGGNPPPTAPPGVGALTIGVALPTGAIGVENDPTFGSVGGFTQQVYSQVVAFAPGTAITIKNLSTTTAHTLNVAGDVGAGAPVFPANPTLSTTAAGGNTLTDGFASGNLAPGASIGPITLTAGMYYIGCAYHYASNQMRSALLVTAAATPGPQATPVPTGTNAPPGYTGGY